MKLNPAWILGRGVIYHDQYSFLLSPIPCIHLWLGHYSCHFQSSSSGGVQSCSGLGVQSSSRGGAGAKSPLIENRAPNIQR